MNVKLIYTCPGVPTAVLFTPYRSPTCRLDKDWSSSYPTIYSFLLSDCLLLDVILLNK